MLISFMDGVVVPMVMGGVVVLRNRFKGPESWVRRCLLRTADHLSCVGCVVFSFCPCVFPCVPVSLQFCSLFFSLSYFCLWASYAHSWPPKLRWLRRRYLRPVSFLQSCSACAWDKEEGGIDEREREGYTVFFCLVIRSCFSEHPFVIAGFC